MARWTAPVHGPARQLILRASGTPHPNARSRAKPFGADEDAEPAKTCYARQASGAALFARRCASPPQSILTAVTERS